jgi:protein involved in polysaccharide export with SLBB domain
MKNYAVVALAGAVAVTAVLSGAQLRDSVRGAQDEVVFVAGSLVSPGLYPYEARMTAGDAIDKAGGPRHPELSSCIFLVRQVDGQRRRTGGTRESSLLSGDTVDVLEVNDGGVLSLAQESARRGC